jgi:DNA-binding NarL/FixJ family response regulator
VQAREGLTLLIDVVRADHEVVVGQLVWLPLTPAPSCAFALLAEDSSGAPPDARATASLITKLSQGIRGAVTSQRLAAADLSLEVDTAKLSSRELEIVSLLIAGDAVSTIAKNLFLSEGAVRNSLATVFGKLGVGNQQELMALLRPARVP